MATRWVVGQHSAIEALTVNPTWVNQVLFDDKKLRGPLEKLVANKRFKAKSVGRAQLDKISSGHQGIAVDMEFSPEVDETLFDQAKSLVLFVDGIEDPQNLGAILRTAWLSDVAAIYIPKNGSAQITSAVVNKVASGGAEHIPVESVHFASQQDFLKEKGFWFYGLAESGSQSLYDFKLPEKVALMVGNEEKGLRKSSIGLCDELCFLPQAKTGSSYNVSVATGMAVAEYKRQLYYSQL